MRLDTARRSQLPVALARAGDPVPPRGVIVVPAGLHLASDDRLEQPGFTRAISTAQPADAIFGQLADRYGPRLITVVLTGRLNDGAKGVQAAKRAGGRVVVQDPKSSTADGMPNAALATGCVDFVLPLKSIPAALISLVMAPGGADLLTVPIPSWAAYA